jgi:hypothetical protein
MNVKGDRNDLKMVLKMGANRDHHTNDRLDDQSLDVNHANRSRVHRDPKTGGNLNVSRDHRMNVTDDRRKDASRVNRNCVRRDRKMGAMTDVSHDHRRSDLLDDHSMVGNHVNRNCVRHDQNSVVTMGVNLCRRMNGTDDRMKDVNRGLHMSDRLDDHSMDDDHRDVLVDHHMNGMGDRKRDGNHVNRNYAPRDRKMGANLDAMNRRVMLMVYLNTSCDRMSHDHLRCDRLKMRHRDMNRKVGMNLDGKMKIRHVIHRMKVCPKTDGRKKI